MNSIERPAKEFRTILAATAPDYRRKTVSVEATTSVYLCDLNWSGGTRNQYRGCTLAGEFTGSADRANQLAPWDPRQVEGQSIPLPQGMVLVRSGVFCGKVSKATIYVNPADMPRLLGAPAAPVLQIA